MFKKVALVASICLAGNAVLAEEYTRIMTEAKYRELIVGRTATWNDGNLTAMTHANGTISGTKEGQQITGTWRWQGNNLCSKVAVGGNEGPEKCKIVALSGDQYLVRYQGNDVFYTIEQ